MKTSKHYKQGIYKPLNPKKWKGDVNNIIYRSGLELKYFSYCDRNPNVLEIASEEFFIPYKGLDGKTHRYFVDLWVKVKDIEGKIKEFIIEIKPYSQTIKPAAPKRITKNYKEALRTYFVNELKWEAARKFAEKNNAKFVILTEKHI